MLSGNKKYIFSQISAVRSGVRSSQQDDVYFMGGGAARNL